MKKLSFIVFLTVCISNVQAQNGGLQSREDSIKMAVTQFFEGFNKGDTSIMKKAVADSMVLQTIAINRLNQVLVRTESMHDLLMAITKRPAGVTSMEERIVFETVKTDGLLATVWTPYTFFVNGKVAHCGVNSFQLVNMNKGWRIVYIIDTRRRQGCE